MRCVGQVRRLVKSKVINDADADEVSAENFGVPTPNPPVEESTRHRLRQLAQVS